MWRSNLMVILVFILVSNAHADDQEMVLQPDQEHSTHSSDKPAAGAFYGSNFPSKKKESGPSKNPASDSEQKPKSGPEIYKGIELPETTPDDSSGGQVAMPIITQKAVMSRSGENWIICGEPIKTVLRGDDAHIDVEYFGNSAFIKFQYMTDGQKIAYPAPKPTTLHIPCGDAIYAIIAVPMDVSSQTIRLGSGKTAKIKDNATIFREQDTRKRVQELIRRAYNDDIPESFTVKLINKPLVLFRDVTVVFHRTIAVDGEGMMLKEYYLTPKVDGIEFIEKQFIRKEISPVPVPVSVIPTRPAKGERARLFVVEFQALSEGKR
jgi:conjugal transfer pilus assembly protein TraK